MKHVLSHIVKITKEKRYQNHCGGEKAKQMYKTKCQKGRIGEIIKNVC